MKRLLVTSAAVSLLAFSTSAWATEAEPSSVPGGDQAALHATTGGEQPQVQWERERRFHPRLGWRTTWRRATVQAQLEQQPAASVQPAVTYRWERQRRFHPKRGSRMHWVRVPVQSQ